MSDGQIQFGAAIFQSLSTFAKKVAHKLGVGVKGTLYNGWRVIFCRGQVMDFYRKNYIRFLEKKKRKEEEKEGKKEENK